MNTKLIMPKLRPEMTEAIFVAWLKEEGEQFKTGDALYEVETDKVINQIEAELDGILIKKLIEVGDEVKPNQEVADIERV